MGRGLSPLQRWILRKAATHGVVYYPEILVEYFGWEPRQSLHRFGEGSFSWWTDERLQKPSYHSDHPIWEGHQVGDMVGDGAHYFDRQIIGYERYRTTLASLSRSVRRLQKRGLLDDYYMHIRLTDKGRECLSVNTITK
jgi:hypothetical protein